MNKSLVYRRCQEVVEAMLNDGFTAVERVSWDDIEPYVAMHCGADPRTLKVYRRYLTYFGFFKETRRGVFQWCEHDKFNNPVKAFQTDFSLLRVLANKRSPRKNY